ncbi:MAG: aldo/keto reductase [Pseudomonadota bacterium]
MMIDRRSVLKGGAAGALTAGAAGALPVQALSPEASSLGLTSAGQAAAADLRRIPSTGLMLPAVGLGSWITFNVGNDPVLLDRSIDVMRAFFEEGGGMIDSSPMYGSAQQTIGHGLAELGSPETLFSADKIWTESGGAQQFGDTRAAWRTDRFDLMQVHNLVGVEENLEMLFARKAVGEIGHVGITTSHGRRHRDFEDVMRRHPLDFVQLTYNVLDRDVEDRLLPLAAEKGIAVIVNRPFRRGALIRRTQGAPLPGFAAELGAVTWADLMLKFILSNPAVTVVIPATTRPDHVRQNKVAARGAMPGPRMRAEIARLVAQL